MIINVIINVMRMILSLNSGIKILSSCDCNCAFYIKQSGHRKNKHGFSLERFFFIYLLLKAFHNSLFHQRIDEKLNFQ